MTDHYHPKKEKHLTLASKEDLKCRLPQKAEETEEHILLRYKVIASIIQGKDSRRAGCNGLQDTDKFRNLIKQNYFALM